MRVQIVVILKVLVALILFAGFLTGCSDDGSGTTAPPMPLEITAVTPNTPNIMDQEFEVAVEAIGAVSISLSLDGNLLATLEDPPWSWSIDPGTLPSGDHEFSVTATDGEEIKTFTYWIGTTNGSFPTVGLPVPDFRLVNNSGEMVHFSTFRAGRPVLLNFWASWCPPCREELPDLQTLHETYDPRGLLVLTIDTEENTNAGAQMLEAGGYTFAALFDADNRVLRPLYQGVTIPTNLLIDRDGRLVKIGVGIFSDYISNDDIEGVLR